MGIIFEHNELTLWRRDLEQLFGRPYQLVPRQRGWFYATARNERFGEIDVTRLFTENAVDVNASIIRNAANPYFCVFFIEGGEMRVSRHKEHFRVSQKNMILMKGHSFWRAYQSESFCSLVIRVPAALARTRVNGIDQRCGTIISSNRGAPRILLDYAQNLLTHADQLSEPLRCRIQDHLLDLIFDSASLMHNAVAHRPDVLSFIRAHLADPELSPSTAAHELGISVRSIHARMAQSGLTFCDYLREQRLEQCRRDLLATENDGESITEIAMRWGFVSISTFSRTFHARFGMPPSVYRDQAESRRCTLLSSHQYRRQKSC